MNKRIKILLWGVLGLVVLVCVVLDLAPAAGGPSRLDQLPLNGLGFHGRDLPLVAAETAVFRRAHVVKRLYQAGSNKFILIGVDGSTDRHAVHDPRFCFRGAGWTVSSETPVPLPGGDGRFLRLVKGSQTAEATFWFSDGHRRHASTVGLWWESVLRRLRLKPAASEPVLMVVQPLAGTALDWEEIVRRCPDLFNL